MTVSLEQRQKDYDEAVFWADHCAEVWLDARSRGRVSISVEEHLDGALRDLKRAKRRLEDTKKRLENHPLAKQDRAIGEAMKSWGAIRP